MAECICRDKRLLVLVLFGAFVIGVDSGVSREKCKTFMENCFTDVSANLACHTGTTNRYACETRDAKDLCISLEDALNCTISISDLNCGFDEGTFSAWMSGLEGAYVKLCKEDISLVENLIDIPDCWNIGRFLSCTEESVGIVHIVDLLSTALDVKECNLLMISIGLCNSEAQSSRYLCRGSNKAVVHAVTSFFAQSSCMNQMTHELLDSYCESQASGRAAVAAISTFLVAVVFVGGVSVVLLRRRVIILNKTFIRFRNEDSDAIISQ